MTRNVALFFLLLVLPIGSIAIGDGDSGKSLFVYIFASSIICISCYFSHRRKYLPTKSEKLAANVWLFIRRSVAVVAILFFSIILIMSLITDLEVEKKFGLAFFSLSIIIISIWVGVYGQGNNRFDFEDDLELHNENKKRYGWRR